LNTIQFNSLTTLQQPGGTRYLGPTAQQRHGDKELVMAEAGNLRRGRSRAKSAEIARVAVGADGMEDPDLFFDAATRAINTAADGDRGNRHESLEEAASKATVRFSLPRGVAESERTTPSRKSDRNSATRLVSRLGGNRPSLSPSDLSSVSTAASSPASTRSEERTLHHATEPSAKPAPFSPESDEFPVGNNDDDDDADLVPSIDPTESDEEDDDEIVHMSTEEEHKNHPEPLNDENREGEVETSDDDEKEGDAFQMPAPDNDDEPIDEESRSDDDDEPAEDVSKKRKGEKSLSKKKKSSKSKRDDETTTTSNKGKRGKDKMKKRKGAFSPKGIQSGPIEHRIIPLSDMKPDVDDNGNLRRSKRARIQPLQWWKNERLEYGPNPDPYDSDVPVAKAVSYAEPTPYKERRIPKRAAITPSERGRKQHNQTHASNDVGNEPFDNSKIRRKYKYLNGEMAQIWDDLVEDATEESKLRRQRRVIVCSFLTVASY
jgi:centromere protein C